MNTHVTPPVASLSPELTARFIAIVGDKYAVTDAAEQEPYLVEGRGLYRGTTPAVLRPGSVEEVAAMAVYLCSDAARQITGAMLSMDGGWTAG